MQIKSKNELVRQDLKRNFLKQIIFRFDFSGVAEAEIESILPQIKELLLKCGYTKFDIDMATEFDFQLDDPETVEKKGIGVRDVRKHKVYVFQNEDPGIVLKISSAFALIEISNKKYINFMEYSTSLLEVMRLFNRDIPFFCADRCGLRKINSCIIHDIRDINNYFEKKYYSILMYCDESKTKTYYAKDCLSLNEYSLNIIRSVINGQANGKDAYQIVLDLDIYLQGDDEIKQLINKNTSLQEMNQTIFNVYKDALTEQFIEELQNGRFIDEKIMGIEEND